MQEIVSQQMGAIRDKEDRNVHFKKRGQKDNKKGNKGKGTTRRGQEGKLLQGARG